MRDKGLDFAKGVAIVCMVLAHAGLEGFGYRFIYLWHMPVFFLVAGWFFVSKPSWSEYGHFVLSKIRRLWVPYVFWCCAFILLHNWFMDLGIYPDLSNAAVADEMKSVYSPWTPRMMLNGMLEALDTLGGNYLIALPIWFLSALMYALIAYGAMDLLVGKLVPDKRARYSTLLFLTMALTVFGRCCTWDLWVCFTYRFGWDNISWKRLFTAIMLLHVGVLAREGWTAVRSLSKPLRLVSAGVAIGALCCIAAAGVQYELCASQYPSVLLLIATAVIGLYALLIVASFGGWGVSVFAYVGRHSLSVLIFHTLAFKLVSCIYISFCGLPHDVIGTRFVAFDGWRWTIVYTIVATALPLLISEGWRRIVSVCRR